MNKRISNCVAINLLSFNLSQGGGKVRIFDYQSNEVQHHFVRYEIPFLNEPKDENGYV
ncbi:MULTISPECIES: hypothetical protein [unclassified Endozoicomonas]|uniref:hypothetical protein n=1 Tax=unclassified Endozoicomonas TaxID=2644528 RepID=UPI003BB6FE70